MWPSFGIWRNLGKQVVLCFPGNNVCASIINNNNFFMLNKNFVCRLDSRIDFRKFQLIETEHRRLSWRLILLLVNNFMETSVDIWALRDKVLSNDPNESSAVYLLTFDNKRTVCGTMQFNFFAEILATILLCGEDFRALAQQGKRSSFTDVLFWTSMWNKHVQILFFNNPNHFFSLFLNFF